MKNFESAHPISGKIQQKKWKTSNGIITHSYNKKIRKMKVKSLFFMAMMTFAATEAQQLSLSMERSLKLASGNNVNIPLKCDHNVGQVKYEVKGLPNGLIFDSLSNAIIGNTTISSGNFPVLLSAQDQGGNSASQIIVLSVGNSGVTSSSPSSLTTSVLNNASLNGITSSSTVSSSSNTVNTSSNNNSNVNVNRLNNILGNLGVSPTTTLNANTNTNTNTVSINDSFNLGNPNSPNSNNGLNSPNSSSSTVTTTSTTFSSPVIPNNPNPNNVSNNLLFNVNRFPTGRNPNAAPNTEITRIITSKSSTANLQNNEITADDIRRTAIFQRQNNANKAIANLLDVIQQRRVNIQTIKTRIPALENDLDGLIKRQRAIQLQITTAENNKKKIEDAITNLRKGINDAKGQLNAVRTNTIAVNGLKTQNERRINQLSADIKNAEDAKKKLEDQLNRLRNEQTRAEQQKINANNQLNILTKKLEQTKNTIADIRNKINEAVDNLNGKNAEVERLERLLTDARRGARDARQKVDELEALRIAGPQQIAKIEAQINQKRTLFLQPLTANEANTIAQIKDIQDKIKDIDGVIARIRNDLTATTSNLENNSLIINASSTQIQSKQTDIQQALNDLRMLENQLPNFTNSLQNIYHSGNDINTKVADTRDNLNALIARLDFQSNQLINFTKQLEIARAEKTAADTAMQALLQQKSDALPYAVIGNRSSSANLALNRDFSNSSTSGGNFYSFDFYNSALGGNSFPCTAGNNFTSIEGIIQAVYGNSITVGVPGAAGSGTSTYNLNVGACSNLLSATQNYKMKVGDRIQASGNGNGSSINLIQGNCY